jgi:hypothetical protein
MLTSLRCSHQAQGGVSANCRPQEEDVGFEPGRGHQTLPVFRRQWVARQAADDLADHLAAAVRLRPHRLLKAFIAWWWGAAAPDPVAIVAGVVAILLAGYTVYIVREFLIHADKNFKAVKDAIEQIENPVIKCLLEIKQKTGEGWLLRQTRDYLKAQYVGPVFLVLLWFASLICALAVVSLMLAAYPCLPLLTARVPSTP